jgi:hypothetical protein
MTSHLSVIPSRALVDRRIGDVHLRILCLLGSENERNGWLVVDVAAISTMTGQSRATIVRVVSDLVAMQYLRRQASGAAATLHQVALDVPHRDGDGDDAPPAGQIENEGLI